MKVLTKIQSFISELSTDSITNERRESLQVLIDYMNEKIKHQEDIKLNFICTHNSRRSQFAQIWAQTLAAYFGTTLESCSGGVEATEFNKNVISVLKNAGFEIDKTGTVNPHYLVNYSIELPPLKMFSKVYDDSVNCKDQFAAIMTCSDANANCPMIPGAENRIPLTYMDPKKYDGTEIQDIKYQETCTLIATELYYVFLKIKNR